MVFLSTRTPGLVLVQDVVSIAVLGLERPLKNLVALRTAHYSTRQYSLHAKRPRRQQWVRSVIDTFSKGREARWHWQSWLVK